MKSKLTEFSYGYALTEHLSRWPGTNLVGAPIFPNLYGEGQWGFGYDVRFDRPGVPLFVQFKLSHYIKSRNAMEFRPGQPSIPLDVPFYRMKLRPTYYSNQHLSLMELAADGNEVYYAAPAFYLQEQLNDAYTTPGAVVNRSVFFNPLDIGPLPTEWKHHVSFDPVQDPQSGYLYSEPKSVPILKPGQFTQRLLSRIREEGERRLGDDAIGSLQSRLIELLGEEAALAIHGLEEFPGFRRPEPSVQWGERRRGLRTIAYLARTFLDSQLVIIQPQDTK